MQFLVLCEWVTQSEMTTNLEIGELSDSYLGGKKGDNLSKVIKNY